MGAFYTKEELLELGLLSIPPSVFGTVSGNGQIKSIISVLGIE